MANIVNLWWRLFSFALSCASIVARLELFWRITLIGGFIHVKLDFFANLMCLAHVSAVIKRLILAVLHAEALHTLLGVIELSLRQQALLSHLYLAIHHLDGLTRVEHVHSPDNLLLDLGLFVEQSVKIRFAILLVRRVHLSRPERILIASDLLDAIFFDLLEYMLLGLFLPVDEFPHDHGLARILLNVLNLLNFGICLLFCALNELFVGKLVLGVSILAPVDILPKLLKMVLIVFPVRALDVLCFEASDLLLPLLMRLLVFFLQESKLGPSFLVLGAHVRDGNVWVDCYCVPIAWIGLEVPLIAGLEAPFRDHFVHSKFFLLALGNV